MGVAEAEIRKSRCRALYPLFHAWSVTNDEIHILVAVCFLSKFRGMLQTRVEDAFRGGGGGGVEGIEPRKERARKNKPGLTKRFFLVSPHAPPVYTVPI